MLSKKQNTKVHPLYNICKNNPCISVHLKDSEMEFNSVFFWEVGYFSP